MATTLGILFSEIFVQTLDTYLPFFAVGLVIWNWMSGQISDAARFFQFKEIIKQSKLPFPIFTLRLTI